LLQTAGIIDRRQRLLRLTPRGQAVESELSALQRARFAKAYREAGPEAVAGFRQVLGGLLADTERAGVLRLVAKR
jgi:DNA-binding MarR family transcriptional regulator